MDEVVGLVARVMGLLGREDDYAVHGSSIGGPFGVHNLFGTGEAGDESSSEFSQRLSRCYELAGHALAFGTAPEDSMLVHGSMHGRMEGTQRIGHAWLILPGDLVWEPITALIHDKAEWEDWTRARAEKSYTKLYLAKMLVARGDWGRWHNSKYP